MYSIGDEVIILGPVTVGCPSGPDHYEIEGSIWKKVVGTTQTILDKSRCTRCNKNNCCIYRISSPLMSGSWWFWPNQIMSPDIPDYEIKEIIYV